MPLNLLKPSTPTESPSPEEIRHLRDSMGLTQTEAGALIYSALRAWQQWEAGDRRMHPALWELFLVKTGQLSLSSPTPKAPLATGTATTKAKASPGPRSIQ